MEDSKFAEHFDHTKTMLDKIDGAMECLMEKGGTKMTDDTGWLAAMLSKQGIDPGIVAMLNDRRDKGDWGDGGMLVILFLILIMGGGNGFWNRNGFNGAEVNGVDRTIFNQSNFENIANAIQTQGTRQEMAIGNLASALNCDYNQISAALAGVDKQLAVNQGSVVNAIQSCCCNIRTEIMQSQNAIQSQMSKCCCDTNLNIERQGCQTRADIQDVRYLIQATQSAQDNLIQSQFASQNAYLADQFGQIRSREDQREIQALREKVQEQRDNANTQAILTAIANRDVVAGTFSSTAGTFTGNIS